MGPGAGLDPVEKTKMFCPYREMNPGFQPVARQYTDRAIPTPRRNYVYLITVPKFIPWRKRIGPPNLVTNLRLTYHEIRYRNVSKQ
jgi:hypothetical protein